MAKFKKDEICIEDECRYLPPNGPVEIFPTLRFSVYDNVISIIKLSGFVILVMGISYVIASSFSDTRPKRRSGYDIIMENSY